MMAANNGDEQQIESKSCVDVWGCWLAPHLRIPTSNITLNLHIFIFLWAEMTTFPLLAGGAKIECAMTNSGLYYGSNDDAVADLWIELEYHAFLLAQR